MENNMSDQIRRELVEIGSHLPQPSGKEFALPEGYFDKLPGNIQERIAERNTAKTRVFRFVSALKPAYAIAASVLLIIAMSGLLLLRQSSNDRNFLTAEDIHAMDMFSLYAGLDPYFMYDLVLDSELTADEIQFGFTMPDNADFDQEAIFDYLDNVHDLFWMDDADTGGNGNESL